MNKLPMQPIEWDNNNVIRFRANRLVEYLLEHGGIDMNRLALLGFSDDEYAQFTQLIGYSVSGFGELSYVSQELIELADEQVKILEKQAACPLCEGTGRMNENKEDNHG